MCLTKHMVDITVFNFYPDVRCHMSPAKGGPYFTKAIASDEKKKSVPLVATENIKKPNY